MRFWRGPGQDPSLDAEPNADYTAAYNLTSGTRINALGPDGVAFGNTGSSGTLGAAVVAVRTAGLQNVRVSWTGGTVATGTRTYALRLQYRTGESGPWQSPTEDGQPVEYAAAASAGDAQSFSTVLPSDAADQPVVQVRWKYYQTAPGTGGRPRLRLDDVTITTSDAAASGTGTAAFGAVAYRGGQATDIDLVVTARSDEAADRLTDVQITLPAGVPAPLAVALSTAGTATIDGRTIRVTGASATLAVPLRITLSGVPLPDASVIAEAAVRTGAGSPQTVAIAEQPLLRVWSTPEAIAAVRANDSQGASTRLGQAVTLRGVMTVSDEFVTGGGERGPSYLQDGTAGIAVYSPTGVAAAVETGEEVLLLGRVDQFFGLNQLDASTVVVDRLGTPDPVEPLVLTLAQLSTDGAGGAEQYEGRLVRVEGVTVNTAVWTATGSGTNYVLSGPTGTLPVRVNPGTSLAGQNAPAGAFAITGVVSQFRTGAPLVGGYQLQPRRADDVQDTRDAPQITPRVPFETAATPTSVTLRWTTSQPSHSEVRYAGGGVRGRVSDEARTTEHALTLTGLAPATIYTLELRSAAAADTAVVAGYPVTTTSPAGTTGRIEVTFNKPVDASVATGETARVLPLESVLIPRINAATQTIDAALYSLSGDVGSQIGTALIAARDRGVRVRVIVDDATNPAEPDRLRAAGLPVITDAFGANNGADGLHHNKVFVIDRGSPDPARAWTMTGSWNPTDSGTTNNFQNVVWIQDAALAGAYTAEFEQMWGSSTATPDAAASRFHSRKRLVTPTAFWINGVYTRLVFSPQGEGPYGSVEDQINEALATADHEVALGLNLITRQSYVDNLRALHTDGVEVRAAIGDIGTTGSVFAPLAAFADAFAFPSNTLGLLHHKYAVVDGQHPESDPVVITGSHNWSRTANESNNENTVLIHDARVANLFLQEFAARYAEAGGTGTFPTGTDGASDARFALSAAAPNPTRGSTRLALSVPHAGHVTVRVYNVLGQEVARLLDGDAAPGTREVTLDARSLAAGVYVVRAETAGGQSATQRITVVR